MDPVSSAPQLAPRTKAIDACAVAWALDCQGIRATEAECHSIAKFLRRVAPPEATDTQTREPHLPANPGVCP